MKPKTIQNTVLPIYEVKDTVVVLASTISHNRDSFSSRMTQAVGADGEPIIARFQLVLTCDDCLEHKLKKQCDHNLRWVPPWKSVRKRREVEPLYGSKRVFEIEALGLDAGGEGAEFSDAMVSALTRESFFVHRFIPHFEAQRLYVTCDPNNGGANHTGIVAGFMYNGSFMVRLLCLMQERGEFMCACLRSTRQSSIACRCSCTAGASRGGGGASRAPVVIT